MAVGKIEHFDMANDDWGMYIERLEQYFIVNNTKEVHKVPILITLMGAQSYELLVTLCTPDKPASKKFADLILIMQNHLQPKPSLLAERYKFRNRKQSGGETISDYVAVLKKMSKGCAFGTWLEDSLKDQFVCGLNSGTMRQRLFVEEDLSFEKAYKLAVAIEAAEKNAAAVKFPVEIHDAMVESSCHHGISEYTKIPLKSLGGNLPNSYRSNSGHRTDTSQAQRAFGRKMIYRQQQRGINANEGQDNQIRCSSM
ncbi:uncharacterized protein [Epargyreus clarus]|uniref:uncharacterized protein n=1 Tax=Epargyreus clarus TaxID=520877 RepID=UPI003C2FB5AB